MYVVVVLSVGGLGKCFKYFSWKSGCKEDAFKDVFEILLKMFEGCFQDELINRRDKVFLGLIIFLDLKCFYIVQVRDFVILKEIYIFTRRRIRNKDTE